jgi:hypothetical protein
MGYMSVTSALRGRRQEDQEFKASMGYIVRTHLQKPNKKINHGVASHNY